jgi:hypothetical protein
MRAARDFMSPKAAGTPIYLYSGGREETQPRSWAFGVVHCLSSRCGLLSSAALRTSASRVAAIWYVAEAMKIR